jgi:glycosyltransferase involved in cell wall biosynthesis
VLDDTKVRSVERVDVVLYRYRRSDAIAALTELRSSSTHRAAAEVHALFSVEDDNSRTPPGHLHELAAGLDVIDGAEGIRSALRRSLDLAVDGWVAFDVANAPGTGSLTYAIANGEAVGDDVALLRWWCAVDAPLSLRHPERALTFAIRRHLLAQHVDRLYARQPIALLAGAWSQTRTEGKRVHCVDDARPPRPLGSDDDAPYVDESQILDRVTLRSLSESLLRSDAGTFVHLLGHAPHTPGRFDLTGAPDEEPFEIDRLLPTNAAFDVVIATDFRIRGGGVNSVLEEATQMKALGLRVGALQLDAVTLKRLDWTMSEHAASRLAELQIPLLNGLESVEAPLTVVRYPPAFAALPTVAPRIDTETAVIVINQPPQRLEGRKPFYSPSVCHANAKEFLGTEPSWWPNGPDARAAMREYSGEVPLAGADWLNVIGTFASDEIIEARVRRLEQLERPVVIGRHARDVANKWPSKKRLLRSCYPDDGLFSIHVLGGAERPQQILGRLPTNWTVWEYGQREVHEFLAEVDVFVFFPHQSRIEPMARSIIEALAAGMPVLLPSRFEPIYGTAPIYCEPEQVIPLLHGFVRDPVRFRDFCHASRDDARSRFGPDILKRRLAALGVPVVEDVSVSDAHG